MNLLTTPILYGLAGVAAVALLFGGVQSYRLKSEQAESIACRADAVNFVATQKGNLAEISNLLKRLADLANARKAEADASAKAVTEAEKLARAADKRNDRLASELAALYARDAGAQTWGSSGVDAGVAAKLPGAQR